jgi:hypothetical protein
MFKKVIEVPLMMTEPTRKSVTPRRTRAERLKEYELSKTAESILRDRSYDDEIIPPFKDDEKYSLEELLFSNPSPMPGALTSRGTMAKVRFDENPRVI